MALEEKKYFHVVARESDTGEEVRTYLCETHLNHLRKDMVDAIREFRLLIGIRPTTKRSCGYCVREGK